MEYILTLINTIISAICLIFYIKMWLQLREFEQRINTLKHQVSRNEEDFKEKIFQLAMEKSFKKSLVNENNDDEEKEP